MSVNEKMTAIADAIRTKTGGTEPLTLDQMATEIAGIGTDPILQEITITENGEYTPDEGVYGFSKVIVESPATHTDEQMLALLERTGTEFAIPEGATKIGAGAFNGWSALTKLSIPATVTSVGSSAFAGCTNLVLKELPDAVTTIGAGAFSSNGGCKYLERLPESLVIINQYCFEYSTNLSITEIPATVKTFGHLVFRSCTGLTEITFKGTPTQMATNIFNGCTNLLTINVPWAEDKVAGAPWGATNAIINYNYVEG